MIRPLALLLTLVLSGIAHADPKLWVHDASNRLGEIDVVTGAYTHVGNTSVTLSDIAFDPNGILYGISFTGGSSQLYTVDTTNAGLTPKGSTGATLNALVFGRNGTLYAAGGTTLYTINLANGQASIRGSFSPYQSAGDLAFDASDNLYLSTTNHSLVRLDPSNGAETLVGPIGFQNVYGLAFGPDSVMYGLSDASDDVFSVNLATGAGTFLANFGAPLAGAYGSSFFEESRPVVTTTTISPGTTTTISPGTTTTTVPGIGGAENCTNCVDDDGDGLTDFEDPSCCTATNGLTLRRASLQAAKKANRLELETQLTGGGLETIDPTKQDLHVQLRSQSGELLCARIPATSFKKKKKLWQFVDRRLTTAGAKGIDGSVVRLLKGQKLQLRVQGKKKVELLGPVPGAGTMTVTFAFRDANGHRCATATRPSRAVGKKSTLRFP
jgi:hypothetical protein